MKSIAYQSNNLDTNKVGITIFRLCLYLCLQSTIFLCSTRGQIAHDNKTDFFSQWLQNNVLSLDSSRHFPLGNVSLFCLGEATHGGHEIELFKHRISKYLIQEQNFRAVLLEIPAFGFAERANRFVLNKQDTLSMKRFPKLAKDFIEWLRNYNAVNHDSVQIAGYDIQYSSKLPQYILTFARRTTPLYYNQLSKCFQPIYNRRYKRFYSDSELMRQRVVRSPQQLQEDLRQIHQYVDILHRISSPNVRDTLQYYCNILLQGVTEAWVYSYNYRDSCMAKNIIAFQQQHSCKVIVWSHLEHLARTSLGMGCHLSQHFGAEMQVIALTFYQGRYTAFDMSKSKFAPFKAYNAFEDSIEWYFHRAGLSDVILPLRQGKLPDIVVQQLFHPHRRMRSIGALPSERFPQRDILQEIDMIGFVDTISPLEEF